MALPWVKIGYDPTPPEPVVDTFYSSTADGVLQSGDSDYLTSRAGPADTAFTTDTGRDAVGQTVPGDYYLQQAFFSFDTSSLPDTDTITAVEFSLYGDSTVTRVGTSLIEARIHDWGASLTTGDWVAGASLSSKTLVATFDTTGWSNSARNVFTSDSAFLSNINKTGTTYLNLSTDKMRLGTAPTNEERVSCIFANNGNQTYMPRLVVTHHA